MGYIGAELPVGNMQSSPMLNEKSMVLLPTPQGLVRERFPILLQQLPKDQVLDMGSVLRRNLIDLQQAMILERSMLLNRSIPKFEPTPGMDIQNLLVSDLTTRLRASESACHGQAQYARHCAAREDGGDARREDSGSSSPSSSCNTHRQASSSYGPASSHSSSRSSHSPSDTPSSSNTCPDRGGSSPAPQSPPHQSVGDSAGAHRSNAKSDGRNAPTRAPPSSHRPSPKGGGGTEPAAGSLETTGRKRSWKILLTAELAAEIYAQRPRRGESTGPSSLEVASRCGVNSKTIRDIWNRETWVRATRVLWTAEEEEAYREALRSKGELLPPPGGDGAAARVDEHGDSQVVQKRRGRPKGVKDSRPRKSRYAEAASPPPGDAAPATPPAASPPHCGSAPAAVPQPAPVDFLAGGGGGDPFGRVGGELPLMQMLGAGGARLWF